MAVVALIIVLGCAGLMMQSRVDPALTDSTADWLVAKAASDGADPWQDLKVLATTYHVPYAHIGGAELGYGPRTHPRTPGALVLLDPLGSLSSSAVYPVFLLVGGVAYLVTFFWLIPFLSRLDRRRVMLGAILGIGSAAYISSMEFGTQSSVLMVCLAITAVRTRQKDDIVGGLALGIAATLKVFPLLLLFPLWMRGRRKAAAAALLASSSLHLAGLALFRLSIADALRALHSASQTWMSFSGNGSLAMPFARAGVSVDFIGWVLVLSAIAVAIKLSRSVAGFDAVLAAVLLTALALSPLSWEHYDLVALIAVAVLFGSLRNPATGDPVFWSLAIWSGLQVLSIPLGLVVSTPEFSISGSVALIGRLVLISGALLLVSRQSRAPRQRLPDSTIAAAG